VHDIARAVQVFCDHIDKDGGVQRAAQFFRKFAPCGNQRVFLSVHPTARWHPIAAAIAVADQEQASFVIKCQHAAAHHFWPGQPPPLFAQRMHRSQA